jgi:DNA/RNA-binding domain of Phe-tRNA-synthetase-like protein
MGVRQQLTGPPAEAARLARVHTLFGYDEAIIEGYPTVRAGVVHATALSNAPSPPGLVDEYQAEQREAIARLAAHPTAEIPSINAWRRAFTGFGVKPTQYRAAVEALLRRLDKQGDIPSINILVDVGNLVSIRHAMPVAVFDRAGISGPITVRFANGDEPFTDLGASEITRPEPGEVIFVDTADVVCARRWCWRQSAQSATRPGTTDALFVIEGLHDGAEGEILAAVGDLASLLDRYQPPSRAQAHHLSPSTPGV